MVINRIIESGNDLCEDGQEQLVQADPRISSPSEGKMTRHWKEK